MPLLGQELRRCKLLKLKDALDAKDQAKANQCEDIDMEDAPIVSSSDADDWQDVVETDICIYQIPSPPPYKQYSRHILNQGP